LPVGLPAVGGAAALCLLLAGGGFDAAGAAGGALAGPLLSPGRGRAAKNICTPLEAISDPATLIRSSSNSCRSSVANEAAIGTNGDEAALAPLPATGARLT
jgi:hypothetical protein